MAVKDIYQLRSPVNTDDLVDQINRMFQRLMVRLDGLDSQLYDFNASIAHIEPSDTVHEETTYGHTENAGTSSTYSRGDHTHGTPAVPDLDDLGDVEFTNEAWGDVVYRGEDAWHNLAAGDDGKVLTTHGEGVPPTWEFGSGGFLRLLVADITAPTELSALASPSDGDAVLVYDGAGKFTIYCYATRATGDSPFVVSGWVAIAGEYSQLILNIHQLLVDTDPTEPNHVVRLADVTAGYWPAGYWPTGYWP